MKEKRQFINDDGEILAEEWSSVPTGALFTDYVTGNGCKIPAHKSGIRMFKDAPFPKSMSYADKGRFAEICRLYLIGDSGILGSASKGGPKAFNALQIGELVGLNPRRAQAWVKKLCGLKVFHRVPATDGSFHYWVNPAYALKAGHRVNIQQYILFRPQLEPLMKDWAIDKMNELAAVVEPMFKCDATAEAERIVNG